MHPWWSSRTARGSTTSSSARCAPAIHRACSVSRPPGTRAPPIARAWCGSRARCSPRWVSCCRPTSRSGCGTRVPRCGTCCRPGDPPAPPRRNGELVFAEVWESRVFGLTMALHEARAFEWEEFRQRLISEIAAWERREEEWSYYGCWLRAFEDLLAHKRLCLTAAVDARAHALAARPKGHDH